jgi:hypothetical protein
LTQMRTSPPSLPGRVFLNDANQTPRVWLISGCASGTNNGKRRAPNYGALMNLPSLITVSATQFLTPELVASPTSKAFDGHVAV